MRKTDRTPKHYSKKISPWDVIDCLKLGFYSGNVIKYMMRFRDKNGLEDLEKAKHYLDVLIVKVKANPNDINTL